MQNEVFDICDNRLVCFTIINNRYILSLQLSSSTLEEENLSGRFPIKAYLRFVIPAGYESVGIYLYYSIKSHVPWKELGRLSFHILINEPLLTSHDLFIKNLGTARVRLIGTARV